MVVITAVRGGAVEDIHPGSSEEFSFVHKPTRLLAVYLQIIKDNRIINVPKIYNTAVLNIMFDQLITGYTSLFY